MVIFQHIKYLIGLGVIPLILLIFLLMLRWKKRAMNSFAERNLFSHLAPTFSKSKIWIKFILFAISLSLLIIAIANPQMGAKMEEVKREGIDLMIALDVSNSMKAEDLVPNRLGAAKQAISKLIENLKGDRIGIIVFGGEAYVQLPITTDYAAAKLFLNNIDTDVIPTQGTNIGAAIDLAVRSFESGSDKNKALVIITDGENHEEDVLKIVGDATEQGIAIHTIGMGSEHGGPIPVYINGRISGYKKDRDGNTVVTRLNEKMLQQIAAAGDGSYIRATNSQVGLNAIFREINKMDKKEFGSKIYTSYEDYFQYFLGAALLFLVIEFFVPERKSNWWSKLKLFGEK